MNVVTISHDQSKAEICSMMAEAPEDLLILKNIPKSCESIVF